MGFIESLRQAKEAEALRAQKAAEQLQEEQKVQAITAEARRQSEEMAKEVQEKRRRQALKLRDDSGIPQLVKRLCEIDRDLSWLAPELVSLTGDSVLDEITWPAFVVATSKAPGRTPTTHYAHRYFQVETLHNGEIVFHCNARFFGKPIVVPETEWRGNKGRLETALGKAYYNPKTEKAGFSGGDAIYIGNG